MSDEVLEKLVDLHQKGHYTTEVFDELSQFCALQWKQLEKEKHNSEQAFRISEIGYQGLLNNLKSENELRKASIKKIKQQILALDDTIGEIDLNDVDDTNLEHILEVLKHHVEKAKRLEEELKNSKRLAESLAEAKSRFLSMMTHEIRTPLSAIIGNIHILIQEPALPDQEEYIHALHISAQNLLGLVNDILDYGRIEEGRISLHTRDVCIRELMKHLVQMNQFNAIERANSILLHIDDEIPEWLEMDDLRMNQVMNNLLSNANKFTENGHIKVKLSLKEKTAERALIHFSVSDTGIGIEKDKHHLIFNRFTQANSEISRMYGGSGLGLTIVRKIIALMGGDVSVNSTPGLGSEFYFTISCKISSSQLHNAAAEDDIITKDLTGYRILLVEDVSFNVVVAKKIITSWNAEVDVAVNGEEAVEKACSQHYHLILMDLQMPVMDGITATRIIREKGIDTPIVALTASSTPDTRLLVLEIGMNNFITKPFNPEHLFKVIYREARKP